MIMECVLPSNRLILDVKIDNFLYQHNIKWLSQNFNELAENPGTTVVLISGEDKLKYYNFDSTSCDSLKDIYSRYKTFTSLAPQVHTTTYSNFINIFSYIYENVLLSREIPINRLVITDYRFITKELLIVLEIWKKIALSGVNTIPQLIFTSTCDLEEAKPVYFKDYFSHLYTIFEHSKIIDKFYQFIDLSTRSQMFEFKYVTAEYYHSDNDTKDMQILKRIMTDIYNSSLLEHVLIARHSHTKYLTKTAYQFHFTYEGHFSKIDIGSSDTIKIVPFIANSFNTSTTRLTIHQLHVICSNIVTSFGGRLNIILYDNVKKSHDTFKAVVDDILFNTSRDIKTAMCLRMCNKNIQPDDLLGRHICYELEKEGYLTLVHENEINQKNNGIVKTLTILGNNMLMYGISPLLVSIRNDILSAASFSTPESLFFLNIFCVLHKFNMSGRELYVDPSLFKKNFKDPFRYQLEKITAYIVRFSIKEVPTKHTHITFCNSNNLNVEVLKKFLIELNSLFSLLDMPKTTPGRIKHDICNELMNLKIFRGITYTRTLIGSDGTYLYFKTGNDKVLKTAEDGFVVKYGEVFGYPNNIVVLHKENEIISFITVDNND